MRLVLVRHGETQLNREGRIQGFDGGALTAAGSAQAQALAVALGRNLPFYLYTSPLTRAVETAAIISHSLGIPFATLEGLAGGRRRPASGWTSPYNRRGTPASLNELWRLERASAAGNDPNRE